MTWAPDTWDAFCGLVDEAWPGTFDAEAASSWRVLLDDIDPDAALIALRRLLLKGQRFRPSVSELLAAVRSDPSRPTFEEAYRLIFGAGGVLRARPVVRAWASEADRARAEVEAIEKRAGTVHPLVGQFVVRQGIDRLRRLGLDDPDYGPLRRKELQVAWDVHVEAFDGREIHALAAGTGREGLRQLDPLAALGLDRVQITQGGEAA